jgi:hypothetical protein
MLAAKQRRGQKLRVGRNTSGAVNSAKAVKIQTHKALSDKACRVYSDLHIDDEEIRKQSREREKKWKAPKQKVPNPTGIMSVLERL